MNFNEVNIQNIIQLIVSKKKSIAIIIISAILIGVFVSSPMVIKPLYKSYALLYPANINPYGQESQTEQAMQFLESDQIKDEIIEQYDLYNRYKIEKGKKGSHFNILKEYTQHVASDKTEYNSIYIEVLDTDPKVASDMCNSIIDKYNNLVRKLHRSKLKEVIAMQSNFTALKKRELDSVESKLMDLKVKYNLVDVGVQTTGAIGVYYKSFYKNVSGEKVKESRETIKNLQLYSQEFTYLSQVLQNLRNIYIESKNNLDNLKKEYNKELTYANIVTEPFPADKKTSPIRWLIVVVFSLSGLAFSLIFIFLKEFKPWQKLFVKND